ncbi:Uncharacterized membrane protein YoaK, UPF0700 family [Pseudonocardia thermophila]|jgi:Predicted membrane protein|uniref:Uncharacterized membrane protein YoaK, UPF0700 family n=2 Tax=Pseudonocardia thermophila TaxID=1848 RepID=A0A1M6UWA0_PSETH|nr:Uncharacterized membrane protein YoaK, UPF0700 family [Pseudonocardia thermophila]
MLLLVLTLVTGVIDAVSLLTLGRVFVANMTGNVVVTGFAIAGVPDYSLPTSLAALACFMIGAAIAGRLLVDKIADRGELLRASVLVEAVLIAICLVIVLVRPPVVDSPPTIATAAVAALAMGVQNTLARRVGVPDLTTTLISMPMVGLAADHRHTNRPAVIRRASAIICLMAGAFLGALAIHVGGAALALGVILVLLGGVALTAHVLIRRGPDWEN